MEKSCSGAGPSLRDLFLRLRAGSSVTSGELRVCEGRIRAVSRPILQEPDLVDECVQDVWSKLLAPELDLARIEDLPGWLHRVARNQAIQNLRYHRRRDTLDLSESRIGVRPVAGIADPFLRRKLRSAVNALPPGMRRVFLMHAVLGYTHSEVARRIGVRPVTVRSQFFKARRKMRAALEEGLAA